MEFSIIDIRYIVFCIDSKIAQHDGKVFSNLRDAKSFILDCSLDHYCSKFIIGSFTLNNSKEMNIHLIETFGFNHSVKNINQLSIFDSHVF